MRKVLLLVVCLLAAGQDAPPPNALPLGETVSGTIRGDGAKYQFDATEPGLLTIAVRAGENAGDVDYFIAVMPKAADGQAAAPVMQRGFEGLMQMGMMGPMQQAGRALVDEDRLGNPANEQAVVPIPQAGAYEVTIGSHMGGGAYQLIAGFLPFDLAVAPIKPDVTEPLKLDEPMQLDLNGDARRSYSFKAPQDGLLTFMTRGAGDVYLMIVDAGGMQQHIDNDMHGNGANEFAVIPVEANAEVFVTVGGNCPSRCAVLATLAPHNGAFLAMARKIAEDFPQDMMGGPFVDAPHPLIDQPMPDITFTTLKGKPQKFSELGRRIVVLDVWATWCGPCVAAMPELQKVCDWVKEHEHPIGVYALNSGEAAAVVRAFVRDREIQLPILLDPEEAADAALSIDAIPMTFIIVDGKVRWVHAGLMPDHAETLKTKLTQYLAEITLTARR